MSFTHVDLVALAAQWLERQGNTVVITELATAAGETPDALGFAGRVSTVIECKISRSDFAADAKKYFRRESWRGMGQQRFYMVPKGLIKQAELPVGWGLIEISDKGRARCIHDAGAYFEKNAQAEIQLLISALRRIGQVPVEGVSVKCYTIQTQCQATLGLAPEYPASSTQLEFEFKEDDHAVTERSTAEIQE